MVGCKLFGIRSFVLEVLSQSGNVVSVNLLTNVIFCPDKKGCGPERGTTFPSEVLLSKRRQVSAGSFLGARFPDPAQLSSLREPGVQDPTGVRSLRLLRLPI